LADIALARAEGSVRKIYLRDLNIEPIWDLRHAGIPFPRATDDYEEVLFPMLESDILVFCTPLYWYSMSGPMKNFIDRWTVSLRDNRFDFKQEMKGKDIYLISAMADSDRALADPLIWTFRNIAKYLRANFRGYVIAHASRPGDVLNDLEAVERARNLLIQEELQQARVTNR
jgi:multimeric flavodoxin WrbA